MKYALLSIALALGACQTATPANIGAPQGETFNWTCPGGATFSVRYTDANWAIVEAGGRTYNLPGVIAASGARYAAHGVEYWEHHGEAMLHGARGGPYEQCQQH